MSKRTVELFRSAVSGGAFLEAEQLLGMYRREVEASWKGATSVCERHAIATEVSGVLEWARTTTIVSRSHAQHALILLGRQGAYRPGTQNTELLALDA